MLFSYLVWLPFFLLFFFFNDTATTEIYTLSLHDALPICRSRAWVPCTGKRGNGHRRYAGNRHPVAVNELRGFRHVVCFPGDWPGDECPASPLRQLTKPPVPCDISASPECTGIEFALGIADPGSAGVTSKKDFRVRTASSADRPARFRRRTSLDRLRNVSSDGGRNAANPSGFERQAISLQVWPTCIPASPGAAPIFGNSDGHKLAAMRPVGPGQAGAAQKGDHDQVGVTHKEFSCRKNWLFPRPPTNRGGGLSRNGRSSKTASTAENKTPPSGAAA